MSMQETLNTESNTLAKGYWVVFASIYNFNAFASYIKAATPALAGYHAKILAEGKNFLIAEGQMKGSPFLIEFNSYKDALACFNSTEYQQAIIARKCIADFNIVVVEGVSSQN